MKVLVLNSGSSTLKFDLVDAFGDHAAQAPIRLAHGLVDRIGGESMLQVSSTTGDADIERHPVDAQNHSAGVHLAIKALQPLIEDGIAAVGHRVVHGGSRFVSPVRIDDEVLVEVERLSELAPLHNPPAVQGILAAREVFGAEMPMVAVFDTAFHSTLPEHAYTYALPYDLAARYGIRRYGFHGTAHEYMLRRYADLKGMPRSQANLVTLQLGNGCSAAAISSGRSVDTSMGFTPLEGLVMGTRSGDIDPGIVSFISDKEGIPCAAVDDVLNVQSGLLGLSGKASDMRALLAAAPSEPRAALAIEVFCYRVSKYIGAYLGVLGGADAVVFGGGIGENSPIIRSRILTNMAWCGLRLDPALNEATVGSEGLISAQDSAIEICVVSVDESLLIAQHTAELVASSTQHSPDTT
jgi:acetate kinase